MKAIISKEQEKNKRKQGNPNFKKGISGNPKGRPKGAKDKIARSAKETIEKAVEYIGGWKELAIWGKKNNRNQEKLYDWYFKLLPSNIGISGDGNGSSITIEIVPAKKKEKEDSK